MAMQIIKQLPEKSAAPEPTAQPAAQPTAKPTAQPEKKYPFTDVKADARYYPNVYYVWDQGLMQGKSASIFDPGGITTRAQMAAIINRFDQLK